MSALVGAWLLSVLGGGLFFGAGLFFGLRRNLLGGAARRAPLEQDLGEARDALLSMASELDAGRNELGHARAQLGLAQQELGAARHDVGSVRQELVASRRESERHAAAAAAVTAERDRLLEAMQRLRRAARPDRPVVPAGRTRGDALRSILEREAGGGGMAGAVIADELGLVVASTGEYGDALAALGAYLADFGNKTRGVLPLQDLRQVIVQDDHDMTLTVRPIRSADDNLALVTLAGGAGAGSRAGAPVER